MTEKIENYYKDLYTNNKEEFNANGHKFEHLYKGRVKLVKEMLGILPKKRYVVLDAGCGNGMFFEDAVKSTIDIVEADGIDLLEEAVRFAEGKYTKLCCGSTVELGKYFETKYDLVNSMEIFSYIKPEDRMKFFEEHTNILQNGGYFLLTVTNLNSIYRKIVKPEAELFPYYFDKDTITTLCRQLGGVELLACKGVDIFNRVHNVNRWSSFFLYELSFLFRRG